MTAFFRVDGSQSLGMGHVARCLNLARQLRNLGTPIGFVTRPLDGHGAARIREEGFDVLLLPDSSEGEPDAGHADAAATLALIGERQPEWLVIDHYRIGDAWETRLRSAVGRILVVDDLFDRKHDCDAILNANVLQAATRNYDTLVPQACRQLLGPFYALLGEDFADLHRQRPPRSGPPGHVVVNFGGSDIAGLTIRALNAIRRLGHENVAFDIILGLGQDPDGTVAQAAGAMSNVRLLPPQPGLASLFQSADLAIGAGGVSMWERCCVGLPSLVITSAENQIEGARAAHEAGLISWAGHHDEVTDSDLEAAIEAALGWNDLDSRSSRAAAAVDGRGSLRIAAMMSAAEAGLLRMRRATAMDEALYLIWANDRVTRAQSLDRRPISPQGHSAWFRARLSDPAKYLLLVAELPGGLEVGQVRFEAVQAGWTIDYSLDPAFRGLGLGKAVLELALEELRATHDAPRFLAEIRKTNPASQRVLRAIGFTLRTENEEVVTLELAA